jgi:hypothetical protein
MQSKIYLMTALLGNLILKSYLLFSKKKKNKNITKQFQTQKILTKHSKLFLFLCHIRTLFQPQNKKYRLKGFIKQTQLVFVIILFSFPYLFLCIALSYKK